MRERFDGRAELLAGKGTDAAIERREYALPTMRQREQKRVSELLVSCSLSAIPPTAAGT